MGGTKAQNAKRGCSFFLFLAFSSINFMDVSEGNSVKANIRFPTKKKSSLELDLDSSVFGYGGDAAVLSLRENLLETIAALRTRFGAST